MSAIVITFGIITIFLIWLLIILWPGRSGKTESVLKEPQPSTHEVTLRDRDGFIAPPDTHVSEVISHDGWQQAIGTSLFRSLKTDKKAAIIMSVSSASQYTDWFKLNSTIKQHNLPIDTWVISEPLHAEIKEVSQPTQKIQGES